MCVGPATALGTQTNHRTPLLEGLYCPGSNGHYKLHVLGCFIKQTVQLIQYILFANVLLLRGFVIKLHFEIIYMNYCDAILFVFCFFNLVLFGHILGCLRVLQSCYILSMLECGIFKLSVNYYFRSCYIKLFIYAVNCMGFYNSIIYPLLVSEFRYSSLIRFNVSA